MAQSSGGTPIVFPAQSFTTTLAPEFKVSLVDPLFSDRFEESHLWQQLNNRNAFDSFSFLQLQQRSMLVIILEYITEAQIEAAKRPIMHFSQLDETPSKYRFPAYTHQLASVDTSLSQQSSLKCMSHRSKDRTVLHPKTLWIRHR